MGSLELGRPSPKVRNYAPKDLTGLLATTATYPFGMINGPPLALSGS